MPELVSAILLKVLKCEVFAKSVLILLLAEPNAAFSLAMAVDSFVENMVLAGAGAVAGVVGTSA